MSVAVVAPIISLIVMGGMLAWQIGRMAEASQWVNHTNQVISKYYEARSRVAEKEGSLRAYLLSGDRAMLALYEQANVEVALDDVQKLTVDNPSQQTRIHDVSAIVAEWTKSATATVAGDAKLERDELPKLQTRMRLTNQVRALINAGVDEELRLLHQREIDNEATDRTAKILFLALLALTALALAFITRRQLGAVAQAFERLIGDERVARAVSERTSWVRRGEADIAAAVLGELDPKQIADRSLRALVENSKADIGAVYQLRGDDLVLLAGYALPQGHPETLPHDRGHLGQVLVSKQLRRIADVAVQQAVEVGTGAAKTVEIALAPIGDERVLAVIELGFAKAPDDRLDDLLRSIAVPLSIALRGAEQRARLKEALEETQRQGEELQAQHEELRVTNEELEHHTTALREANQRKETIQHELEATNANLEEQAAALEQQRGELLTAQAGLQQHARDLQLANQYKSEFLARMSHELRTPLNSSLILSRLLADNPQGNLTAEQVRFASTINSAGNDLLLLINDILDLAKIEAGRLELRLGTVVVSRIRDTLMREFEPVAESRGLRLFVDVDPSAPEQLHGDEQRLVQVLRNLVSNACKFTDRGEVRVAISGEAGGSRVRFAVRDTGVGIPQEHLERVFEAFHQVDGGANRKHGGTGLGLAISRDLAQLMGGTLSLASTVGAGSTFTLEIPTRVDAGTTAAQPVAATAAQLPPVRGPRAPTNASIPPTPIAQVAGAVTDDREKLQRGKKTLLIIDDDPAFAAILRDLGRELEFQTLVAHTADQGVALAMRFLPDGILCDVNLPDHSGLSVLERLKRQPSIRHVPIHMLSVEDHAQRSLELGAIGYLLKPTTRDELAAAIHRIEDRTDQRVRHLLIVEDDERQVEALRALLGGEGVEITTADGVRSALVHLGKTTFDCVVMDLRLSDGTGFELLEKMAADESLTFPPVIVHTGKALTEEEEAQLRAHSSSIVVKGARSPERLVDEVTLFLHQVEAKLPPERQRILREVRGREAIFEDKRVLVVEDDIRNVFALTSILEPRGLKPIVARNGREALEVIQREHVDLVLMDVMMPEMNGIDATRAIRADSPQKDVPIIALTAKAMADDRQACLDAGANDYLAKPIDVDMLLSLLRVWMPR